MSPSLPPSALPNQSKLGLKQSLQTTQDKRPYTPYPRAFLFSLDLSYHVPQSYPSSEGFARLKLWRSLKVILKYKVKRMKQFIGNFNVG